LQEEAASFVVGGLEIADVEEFGIVELGVQFEGMAAVCISSVPGIVYPQGGLSLHLFFLLGKRLNFIQKSENKHFKTFGMYIGYM
jgi:hypothetical protein